jgi:hypothetical protein
MSADESRRAVRAAVLIWDYRQQPDLDHLARVIHALSDGRVSLRPVDTGG